MIDTNYDFIRTDFLLARNGTSSDYSYVLRKMLMRGIEDASFRSRISAGDKSDNYKHIMCFIEDALDRFDWSMDTYGKISEDHKTVVLEALQHCRCLLAIDQAEASADYNNLTVYIADDRREDGCKVTLAA